MTRPGARSTRRASRPERFRAVLALLALASLAACGTTRSGHYWGETATLFPGGDEFGTAARDAALDPWTWVPLAGAAVLSIDDWDEGLSEWAREETPVFGSQQSAADASGDLRGWAQDAWLLSILATPSGEGLNVWAINKLQGFAVEWGATYLTRELTEVLESAVDRERPDGADTGCFPSAQASEAFAYSSLTWRNLQQIEMPEALRWTLGTGVFTLAAGSAWARVESGANYPTDVLVGAALGNFMARFVHDAFLGPVAPTRLTAYADPGSNQWALGLAWSW